MTRLTRNIEQMARELNHSRSDSRVAQLRAHLRRIGRHEHAGMRAPAEVAASVWLLCDQAVLPLAQSVLREVWQ